MRPYTGMQTALDVCFINTLPAAVGAQHAAPLLPEGYALVQDLRNGHLGCEMFSSVTCSACLARTGPSGLRTLGVREWTCSACGLSHDQDINAAQNILRLGRQTPIKGIPVL